MKRLAVAVALSCVVAGLYLVKKVSHDHAYARAVDKRRCIDTLKTGLRIIAIVDALLSRSSAESPSFHAVSNIVSSTVGPWEYVSPGGKCQLVETADGSGGGSSI